MAYALHRSGCGWLVIVLGAMFAALEGPTALAQTLRSEPTQTAGRDSGAVSDKAGAANRVLRRKISAIREAFRVPGMAVAVVKGEEVILAEGFGVRALGTTDAIDADTIFGIASATKSFTAAAIAMLVDEGELNWDDRVIDHLPWFRLKDPYVTVECTIRDLLSHRSGVGRGGMIYYHNDFSREEVVRRLRNVDPARGFRSGFAYSNILYMAAGLIILERTGESWESFVRHRLLRPLGMNRSYANINQVGREMNMAVAHGHRQGQFVAIGANDHADPNATASNDDIVYGPAGTIVATASDMAQWIKMLLNDGTLDGQRVLSSAAIGEMMTPQTIIHSRGWLRSTNPSHSFSAYGMGWFLQDYRGEKLVHHPGGGGGIATAVHLIPARKLGVVVMANRGEYAAPFAVANTVLDVLLGAEETDWVELLAPLDSADADIKREYEELMNSRVPNTKPSLALAKYAGRYVHDLYGEIIIELTDGHLVFRRGDLVGNMTHWNFDTFAAWFDNGPFDMDTITFSIDSGGEATSLTALDVDGFRRPDQHGHH